MRLSNNEQLVLDAEEIKIAIDDFDSGYSSLVQLRKMPISILKIDRNFVFLYGQQS
ncbi:MAG: EAL domain-containing protein [Colwellia sp.]|nr:EAL domain-containing protein [Colwellia sp.]